MKSKQKEAVMADFKAGRIQLLVATTVIEVGIDVPNATVMLIEHAERFGLAQLHQLRGRVGRGAAESLCILLAAGALRDQADRRLEAMVRTQDGFVIAEEDLSIRGPGEFFGTRQSGLPGLRLAHIVRDAVFLEPARAAAERVLAADPMLARPEQRALRQALDRQWGERLKLGGVG
jgi:ATP-dependent DNA helicase RecG